MSKAFYVTTGELYDYHTGDYLRPATPAEARASREAAETDGGAGAIDESDLSPPEATYQFVGDRVEAGTPGTEDYDTGVVHRVDGDQVTVGWDSGVTTTQRLDAVRKL